jgi:hypothetical protein
MGRYFTDLGMAVAPSKEYMFMGSRLDERSVPRGTPARRGPFPHGSS